MRCRLVIWSPLCQCVFRSQLAADLTADCCLHMDTADTDTRLARQYGGYGNYGGFVECCEGVVDPLFLLARFKPQS